MKKRFRSETVGKEGRAEVITASINNMTKETPFKAMSCFQKLHATLQAEIWHTFNCCFFGSTNSLDCVVKTKLLKKIFFKSPQRKINIHTQLSISNHARLKSIISMSRRVAASGLILRVFSYKPFPL